MTRSIFDPNGGEAERSGSRFMPPAADDASQMPPDVTDGNVGEEESRELRAIADAASQQADSSAAPAEAEADEYDH